MVRTDLDEKKDENNQKNQEVDDFIPIKDMRDFKGMATIEKNPKNLNITKYEKEFEIDPLFQKTSAKFDEGGAHGLLLNNLSIDNDV